MMHCSDFLGQLALLKVARWLNDVAEAGSSEILRALVFKDLCILLRASSSLQTSFELEDKQSFMIFLRRAFAAKAFTAEEAARHLGSNTVLERYKALVDLHSMGCKSVGRCVKEIDKLLFSFDDFECASALIVLFCAGQASAAKVFAIKFAVSFPEEDEEERLGLALQILRNTAKPFEKGITLNFDALDVLTRLGKAAIPFTNEVAAKLQSEVDDERHAALQICQNVGNAAAPFVKEVVACLSSSEDKTRLIAMRLLHSFGDAVEPFVKEVAASLSLSNECGFERIAALRILLQLGDAAAPFVQDVANSTRSAHEREQALAWQILRQLGESIEPSAGEMATSLPTSWLS